MKNICDWNNCNKIGEYKAPIERDNSRKYRLLCLEHVREFNKKWDYFSGMSDNQIYDFIKSDLTWHKPTQSFNSSDNFFKILWNNTLKDETSNGKLSPLYNNMGKFRFDENDMKAFKILGLIEELSGKVFKRNLKNLSKNFTLI